MALLLDAKGVAGQIEVHDEKIVIKRAGALAFLSHGMKGNKEIPISQITAIQFKPAGSFINGYLQFSILGGVESKGGVLAAGTDENTLMFRKAQQPDFEKAKQLIEVRIYTKKEQKSSGGSDLAELEKLANLKKKGIISREEFEAKKKKILGL